jgi:hypothetical protein
LLVLRLPPPREEYPPDAPPPRGFFAAEAPEAPEARRRLLIGAHCVSRVTPVGIKRGRSGDRNAGDPGKVAIDREGALWTVPNRFGHCSFAEAPYRSKGWSSRKKSPAFGALSSFGGKNAPHASSYAAYRSGAGAYSKSNQSVGGGAAGGAASRKNKQTSLSRAAAS